MSERQEQMQERVREAAAEFLMRESNRQSLITVTAVRMDERGGHASIYITVLPDSAEEAALAFANRQKREFGEFLLTRVRGMRLPKFEFVLDQGEKMRQRLDELS
jgi:ribosome-binding factor A